MLTIFCIILFHNSSASCSNFYALFSQDHCQAIQELSKWYFIGKHDYSIRVIIYIQPTSLIMCWLFYWSILIYFQSPFEKSGCLLVFPDYLFTKHWNNNINPCIMLKIFQHNYSTPIVICVVYKYLYNYAALCFTY